MYCSEAMHDSQKSLQKLYEMPERSLCKAMNKSFVKKPS